MRSSSLLEEVKNELHKTKETSVSAFSPMPSWYYFSVSVDKVFAKCSSDDILNKITAAHLDDQQIQIG